ncbi:MAG: malto-oligosyltrehalose trehalohydrolase [Rhodanobacteraceae bacterium]
MRFAHTMPFGAQVCEEGVRFRLWAPAQNAVRLVIELDGGEHELAMTRDAHGWFALTTDAARAGTRYGYRLDDGTRVPDPASRFQPEDVHAASEVIDPGAYAWQHPDWHGRPWRETVLYEAHVGAFSDGGDYEGARRKLDHLAGLGVTAVELMPLADFEGRRNWGYDGVLPFAPDAAYGRPESLKALIDAAHARGLMMFLDVVYNHFGPSGNHLHKYAPQFFTGREHTPWGAAIDFSGREVRDFFIHNALYWLGEYRFDGLRLDAVDQIRDASRPHILDELAQAVRAHVSDRHVHLVLENDDNAAHYLRRKGQNAVAPAKAGVQSNISRERVNLDSGLRRNDEAEDLRRNAGVEHARDTGTPRHYTAQWNDDFHHAAHRLATGEANGYYVDYPQPVTAFARALAEGFVYQGERSGWRDRARGEPSAALPPLAFVNFLQNHDQTGNRAFGERLAALADAQAVEALTAILLLAPAVPLLFMGEEWGSTGPWLFFCDYTGELSDAVREGRRREFSKFAVFANPMARERIPDPNAGDTFVASRLDWREPTTHPGQHHLGLVRTLLDIRRCEIVPRLAETLHGGRFRVAHARAVFVEWTLADDARLQLAANPTAVPASGLDWHLSGRRLYAHPDGPASEHVTDLPAWSVIWSLA